MFTKRCWIYKDLQSTPRVWNKRSESSSLFPFLQWPVYNTLNSKPGVSLLIIFNRRATGFCRWTKCFKLKFFIRRPLIYMVKPDRPNCLHTKVSLGGHLAILVTATFQEKMISIIKAEISTFSFVTAMANTVFKVFSHLHPCTARTNFIERNFV